MSDVDVAEQLVEEELPEVDSSRESPVAEIYRSPVDDILDAYDQGHRAVLLSGRSLLDLVHVADARIRTLKEELRQRCRERAGLHVIEYSLSRGVDYDGARIDDPDERRRIEQLLQRYELPTETRGFDEEEPARVLRAAGAFLRTRHEVSRTDGSPLRFAILIEFAEHLTPGGQQPGTQPMIDRITVELASVLAASLALRASGNMVLFHGREGLIHEAVSRSLHSITLRHPCFDEKRRFIETARQIYDGASFEGDLSPESVARLTENLPNRGLETLLRWSSESGAPVTVDRMVEQKARDVSEISEGTLSLLDTSRVANVELHGRNIEVVREVMGTYASALLTGDPAMPANILLAGAPGTAKTDLALMTARDARVSAYEMVSPKNGIVGETERRSSLQMRVLKEFGGIAVCDEITEAFPMQRSDFDGDSGASRAVMAALFTALSDETRRGRSLLVATTNCPWRISAAMRARFQVIPVLMPVERDYAGIVATLCARLDAECRIDPEDEETHIAADMFYAKSASPRQILAALNQARLKTGRLSTDVMLSAAEDVMPPSDGASAQYADLTALQACTLRSFVPWVRDPASYPFPDYFDGIVDPESGEIDRRALVDRIEELRPYANV